MAVEGELKDISLIGVMQIICLERRKAGLFVRRRGEEGAIFFDNGEIVHATAGHTVGEEAVYQLLSWTDGSFRMNDQVMIPSRSIGKNWNHLLMEGMRRMDEQKKNNGSSSTMAERTLSQAETEQDRNLENDLMVLLSNLEQMVARLNEKKLQKRSSSTHHILVEMVNHVAAFSEGLRKINQTIPLLRNILTEVGEGYPYLRMLPIQGNRIPVQLLGSLDNGGSGYLKDRQYSLRQVSQGLAFVLESYFKGFESFFRSPAMAKEWKETYNVFVADLRHSIERVQF
ncbi:MAG TPA: DUF4388 domain-containing protein [Blastocatellia bacterium]|nr:DUF4388 domain-containing protein [Blastocatellia bacterium]